MRTEHLDARTIDMVSGEVAPRFGDYPVSLLTRRTLALRSSDLLEARGVAPTGLRMSRGGPGRHPFPC